MKPDIIQIRRLQVSCHIGVPDEERAEPQTLAIHLILEPRHGFSDLNDEISRTVDYHAVAVEIQSLAESRPRRLIETLAEDVAAHLLQTHPLRAVEVEIEKRILPQTDWVGVRIRRESAT